MTYTFEEQISGVMEAKRLSQWNAASDFDPVGIYLPPGQSIEIEVRNLEGNTLPKLHV